MSEKSDKNYLEEMKRIQAELELEKEHSKQLERLLSHNPETGLPLKSLLIRRLRNLVLEEPDQNFILGVIRLDRRYQRIKNTRDRMRVLLYISAQRVKSVLGDDNVYQSDRNDEFVFIAENLSDHESINELVEKIQLTISEKHNAPATDISFGSYIGIAQYPQHAVTVEELELNAEIALGIFEHKKDQGSIYSPTIGKIYHENEMLVHEMNLSFQYGFSGFHIVYQPIFDVSKTIIGCEALLRWNAPGFGVVPPLRFIPLAEEYGQITVLGKWVLFKALEQTQRWREHYNSNLFVSVNVSAVQMESNSFVEEVEAVLEATQWPGEMLHVEITESSVMNDPAETRSKLNALRSKGVRIMVDDFGTGFSNLNYIHQYPIDTLKIPKEFIDKYPQDKSSEELIRAICGLAKSFGYKTLVEGVEREEQLEGLLKEKIDLIQGFLLSRPLTGEQFERKFIIDGAV